MAEMMTGFCTACGTGQTVRAETQEEADRKATETGNRNQENSKRIEIQPQEETGGHN